jgi:hypothetical protein
MAVKAGGKSPSTRLRQREQALVPRPRCIALLDLLEPDHCESRFTFSSAEQNLVALLDVLEQLGISCFERHDHAWHVQVFKGLVFDGHLALLKVRRWRKAGRVVK